MVKDGPSFWALWAKSDAGGRPHSLPAHLLDTGAVAELVWDEFLSEKARHDIDAACGGHGRQVLVLTCAWHDLGKATPSFQSQVAELRDRARQAGWVMPRRVTFMPHGPSGARIARRLIGPRASLSWLCPLIAGHHGAFLADGAVSQSQVQSESVQGPSSAPWTSRQVELARWVAAQFGLDVEALARANSGPRPSVAVQLACAGLVSMADWIASSSLFPGTGLEQYDVEQARRRARTAWVELGLGGGWRLADEGVPFEQRFGFPPRPLQTLVTEAAQSISGAGLVIVEAPMGEGKTEAALHAAETLARRLGLGGVVFAMPTQGTTDAMFDRVQRWADAVDPMSPPSLLHGKAMANEAWRSRVGGVRVRGVCDDASAAAGVRSPGLDDFGMVDAFGVHDSDGEASMPPAGAPSAWLLGRHRGLLSPSVVATVDQPLVAATLVKYVSLRYAGLLGKCVVIDEVHSYDVHMGQYLHQFLRFCRELEVPVIIMSATLPPGQRAELLRAYADGLSQRDAITSPAESRDSGYPAVTTWTPEGGVAVGSTRPWREDLAVSISWAPIADPEDTGSIAALAGDVSAEGGVVLVVVNLVRRAQEVYQALAESGVPAELLHGRLTTAERARRTAELIEQLGSGAVRRPERLVVVATQIAEQSFDIDADFLITDIAPMDLLLQRVGRLHRHARKGRPAALRLPRVLVSGVDRRGEVPAFPRGIESVYERHALLRTAEAVGEGAVWAVPSQVPELVGDAYEEGGPWPPSWADVAEEARAAMVERAERRTLAAQEGVLAWHLTRSGSQGDLTGLHATGVARGTPTVRDGEPSREVALVVSRAEGVYETLGGRPLGPDGMRVVGDDALAREVLGDSVRVRETEELGDIEPLPGWDGCPLLAGVPTLVLDEHRRARGAWGEAEYDDRLGLTLRRPR